MKDNEMVVNRKNVYELEDHGMIIMGKNTEDGYELTSRRIIGGDLFDRGEKMNFTCVNASDDFEEERDNIILDIAFLCEELVHMILHAEQFGYKGSAASLRDCINHLQSGFIDPDIDSKASHKVLPRYVQIKNPRSGCYVKIDRATGTIEETSEKNKKFKGIKLIK